MAVVVTADIPGGSLEQDRAVMEEVAIGASPAAGILFRAAGPIPGGWRILSVWESREAFERFYRDRIAPANQKLGIAPAVVSVWELQQWGPGPGSGAAS